MTARDMFEACLTELSKVNAPSMLLLDFNYFCNKAVNQYINKKYNIYDINQQSTDDLRVLKATAILPVNPTTMYENLTEKGAGMAKLFGATYEVNLPDDYLHMLNCICIYDVIKRYKCYNAGDSVLFAAKRLTADAWSIIVNDFYNRPLPQRPYYYIHNVNTSVNLPTNPVKLEGEFISSGTDASKDYTYTIIKEGDVKATGDSNFPRKINLKNIDNNSFVERETALRYGNASKVRCEIRYGKDSTVFKLTNILVDYIKTPLIIRLTLEQIDLTEDTSQILEFPDYVCLEIINELVLLVMENTADPRLLTHSIVSQSIANPAQQLTTPVAKKG